MSRRVCENYYQAELGVVVYNWFPTAPYLYTLPVAIRCEQLLDG